MSDTHKKKRNSAPLADKALEMVMRDVLSGMHELAAVAAFDPAPCEFVILPRVESEERPKHPEPAKVLPYPEPAQRIRKRARDRFDERADMVDYLTRREIQVKAL